MKIENVNIGWPIQVATDLMVRVLPFETSAVSCGTYYEIKTEAGELLASGNIQLTEEEFSEWSQDNTYVENIVLNKLGLTRLEVIE